MKIPEDKQEILSHNPLVAHACDVAYHMTLKYGIYVDVKISTRDFTTLIDEIKFEVDGHLFDNLIDLEKALKNKAFI